MHADQQTRIRLRSWREFFKDLKRRGLDGGKMTLGVMDGLPALEKIFKEEFANAQTQRCHVHVARNVLAKVPRSQKQAVADDMHSIFYAASKKKALEFWEAFRERWEKEIPSAVRCQEQSIDSCLTFFEYPPEEWISPRTTNIIERLNKEFRRRTKPMEIVAGENACYRLLAFISLKNGTELAVKPHRKTQNPHCRSMKNSHKKLDITLFFAFNTSMACALRGNESLPLFFFSRR